MALMSVGLGTVAVASQSDEQGFFDAINSERAAAGRQPLALDTGLRSFARNHTQFMIDGGCSPNAICHSTNLGSAATGWSALGENVGRGGTVASLHQAFMNSSGHRANILDTRWNYVGIGADYGSNGSLYVTVVFMQKNSGGGSPTTTTTKPAAPTTTKAKAPTTTKPSAPTTTTSTTTTTTLPPTTTTTLIVGPDKPVTPGGSCLVVTRFGWICRD